MVWQEQPSQAEPTSYDFGTSLATESPTRINQNGEDYDAEELELIARAEAVRQAKMQEIYQFQQQEMQQKQARRQAGA